jgi:hypothetical protein
MWNLADVCVRLNRRHRLRQLLKRLLLLCPDHPFFAPPNTHLV